MNIDNFVKNLIAMERWAEKAKEEVSKKATASSYHIEIHNDGKTTECMLFYNDNLVKRTTAECCPEDKFNLSTGAKIALERMFPSKKSNNSQKEGHVECQKAKETEVKEETKNPKLVKVVRIRLTTK